MEIVFALKPLVDMLYQLQILDVLLLVVCVFCYFSPRCRLSLDGICFIDIIVLVLISLFFFSFIRNINGWAQFLKIESSFLLYFIGRAYNIKNSKVINYVQIGFLPVMALTIIALVTGLGFVYWGSIYTFRGFYYFKTDLALAMTQCFVAFSFYNSNHKSLNYFILIFCALFILLSNARIYYLILVFVVSLVICNYYERKTGRIMLRLNVRFMFFAVSLVFITIMAMVLINKEINGKFLLLDLSGGLFSDANTQGRTIVWAEIYNIFANKDLFTRFIGIDLCSDISPSLGFNSHNSYLKILFSTGYVGLLFFSLFLIYTVRAINRIDNRSFFYLAVCLFLIYLVGGLSYITIESTQGTWLAMYVIGAAVKYDRRKILLTRLFSRQ